METEARYSMRAKVLILVTLSMFAVGCIHDNVRRRGEKDPYRFEVYCEGQICAVVDRQANCLFHTYDGEPVAGKCARW
jgi:hypothetical protein